MECFLTELGKTLTEKVLNKAIEKSRNIFCFTCIVKEFNEEKEKLEAGRATLREQFQVATNKGKGIKADARFWEEHAGKHIQENTETKKSCFFGFCPDCIWRYKRGEELATKTKDIRKLMKEKFENVELDRHLPGVERYSSQDYISFESRKLKYKELLDALRDDNNYLSGLQGMGGTGKTTLAKEVGKQLKTLEQFDHVIDTTVSFTPDIKKIQDDIAGPLGLKWEDISESDRPKKLWSRLTNGEKILLILDDVWGNLNFDDIGIPKSDNHKGCKLLVTTRNLRVCNQMVCEKTIQLDLLNEEEAWSMFKLHANLTDNSSQSILKKGRKIATECKRLPVAIATVASSLKGQKRREEWDISLKTLQKPVSVGGVGDDLVDIYKCLKFSYDFLKDKKAEGLFLLCSTFPEDAKISTEVLTRLGIGVGLFGDDYGSYEDARIQAVASKNKLLDSCLLLETEEGDVKMHDLVREVAQLIAKNEIKIVNFSNKSQKSLVESDKKMKYLICEGNLRDLFASKFDGSELEILSGDMHMEDILHIPISFFENIPRLRVLNLSCHSSYHHPLSLPQSMKSLLNIRSLSFGKVDLGDISVFGSLKRLETLKLTRCAIEEFPHEIEKLENFRLLELQNCEIRNNNPFEVIQRCPLLEELYILNSFNDSCKEITLPTLQRYHLSSDVRDYLYMMEDTISRGVSLTWDYFSEATLKYVMETTELLHLEGTNKGWRNLMPGIVPIDNGMNDLIKLVLKNFHQVQCLVDTKHNNSKVPSVFSKLVVLELEEMKNLEELCNGPIFSDSMNKLEELTILECGILRSLFKCSINFCNLKNVTLYSCSMLVSVFYLSTSRGLPLLEKLDIYDCEQLENIITTECEEIVDGDNDIKNSCNSMFPNLKFLDIDKCPKLQFVLPCYSAGDFLLLESIQIEGCDELEYIFGQHQDVKLASLTKLKLDDVPNFIDILPEPSSINKSSNSISKPQSELEQVKSNTFFWSQICCYGYKSRGSSSTKIPLVSEDQPKDCSITLEWSSRYAYIWERAQCLSTSRLSHILCNIKVMELSFLEEIKSVFVMSISSKLSLETLTINYCDELEHIIVDIEDGSGGNNWGNNVFPKLKVLNVNHCEKLKYIFGHIDATNHHQNHNNEVTHLHLPALECFDLDHLPSLVGMCTKHYRTTLPALTEVRLVECSKVDTTSIFGDFIVPNYSNKELIANVEHFLSLEKLKVHDSKEENIFCLNEVSEQQMNFGLQDIELHNLPMITCLFKGRKNYFSLQNLTKMNIKGCEKLEFVFSTSIIMCLPQLLHIRIDECKELKHMIEDDLESKKSSNFMATKTVCFPKLQTLVVKKCKMLKYVFPISICKELPELEAVVISEAYKLEEIFVCEEADQKVNMPNLKVAALDNLPSLYQTQEIHFQAVQKCFVQNCKKLSLTSSALTEDTRNRSFYHNHSDYFVHKDINSIIKELLEETGDPDTTEDIAAEIEVQVASGHISTSSQEYGDGQIAIPFFPTSTTDSLTIEDFDIIEYLEITQTNNDQGEDFWDRISFLNEDAFKKVSSMIQEKFPVASQFASKDFDLYLHMESAFPQFQEEYKGQDNGNENLKAETTKEFASWIEVQAALGQNLTSSQIKMKETLEEEHEFVENVLDLEIPSLVLLPTNSEELINEQSMDQHHISSFLLEDFINEQSMDHQYLMNQPHSLEETDTTVKPSHGNNFVKESENQSIQCCATSEKTAATTFSTFLGTRNEPPIQLVAPKPKRVEEGNTLTNADAASPSAHLELVSSSQEQDVDVRGFHKITKTNNDQFSLNHNAFIQLTSIIEEQFPEDDDFRDSKSKPSPTNSIPLPLTSQTLPMPFEGEVNVLNPSEIVENSSSPCIVKWELEQLVSENYLDNENLSLCTISATENEPPIQVIDHKQKGIKITVEEVTALTNTKTLKSSTYSKSLSSSSQDEIIQEGSTSGTKNDQDIQLVDLKRKRIKSSFEDVDLGDSHEPTQINNNQGDPSERIEDLNRKVIAAEIEVEVASGHMLTSSQLEDSRSEKPVAEPLSATENQPHLQVIDHKQKGIEITVEEGTALTNTKTLKSSTHSKSLSSSSQRVEEGNTLTNADAASPSAHLELVSSSQEQDVDVRGFHKITKTNNDQFSLNHNAFIQLTSIIEEQFPEDDDFRDSKSKPSPTNSIPLPLTSQTLPMPFEGEVNVINPSEIVENSSSPCIVKWELEQLVSENYLDYENLSLLTDFFVKYPSVLLRDTSLSTRYKCYAYTCLAELLQFLQTHSVLDVLGSSHSEFVKLIHNLRSFGFDKDWLDSVERRALFSDIKVSQDALQKLLDSKQQVSKEVEVLRLKIDILSQHVEDLKHQLTTSETVLNSIIQEEAQVLETKATFSAPLGY